MADYLTQAQEALAAADPSKRVTLLESKTPGGRGLCKGAVVLRHLPDNTGHPFVTHWRNDDLGGYHKGGYFSNLPEAVADWRRRAAQGR
ncbi:hypothetical protein KIKIMORA_04620 [Brevundimonas phage vB_BpoS-Kikimora]|uniref:Uncharacterized protein n=1 Tax=Brevundimonas phage vB_BpoS-Kikimora TaxID=2948601 RepID=A0A9E7SL36_9CAUD|nr:hypothetical protein KIKIMORA_04620 [Brevundimonas phage vB_BpoS-Kikimora]